METVSPQGVPEASVSLLCLHTLLWISKTQGQSDSGSCSCSSAYSLEPQAGLALKASLLASAAAWEDHLSCLDSALSLCREQILGTGWSWERGALGCRVGRLG